MKRTIGRCSVITSSCSAVRRSREPGGSTAVDGPLGGLDAMLPRESGCVRRDFGADKSVRGGAGEPFVESLIFIPAVMRWPTGGGAYCPSEPSEAVRGGTVTGHFNSYTGFIDTFVRNVSDRKSANSLRGGIILLAIARAALRLLAIESSILPRRLGDPCWTINGSIWAWKAGLGDSRPCPLGAGRGARLVMAGEAIQPQYFSPR
jgi:hypothetical protein